jgi:flotillin
MGVEEVLTDKAPIIEELTARLKAVTEGRQEAGGQSEGLGIKIVTVQIREALVSSEKLWQDLQAPFRHQQEKTARISLLTLQEDMRQKELEARQSAETSEAQTMVEIERIKQSKQTEAAELKLTEEGIRFTKEQESLRHKTQLEEQTTVTRQESEQRLQTLTAKMEQERKLAALQRSQKEALERARLDNEAENRQKTLQIEQALHALAENTRLAELELQAEQERLRRAETLKQQEAALNMLLQEQADALQGKILETRLAREQQETLAKLELDEAANRVTLALREKEIALTRLQQEVRNLINQTDLLSRLVDKLPEIAAQMPEIQELKVLQTGSGDAAFDTLAAFVTKVLALAESLGISLPGEKKTPPQE